jgi:hypothetical protein
MPKNIENNPMQSNKVSLAWMLRPIPQGFHPPPAQNSRVGRRVSRKPHRCVIFHPIPLASYVLNFSRFIWACSIVPFLARIKGLAEFEIRLLAC